MVPFLVAMMLLTGVCNTLLTKYQDNQCVRNCDDPDPRNHRRFEQPILQSAQMFVGEMGCWLVVGAMALYRRLRARAGSSPTAQGSGYQAISTTDRDVPAAVDEDGQPKDRPSVLRGYRITLLALPAVCDICATTLMNAGLLLVAASIYQMTRGALVLFVGVTLIAGAQIGTATQFVLEEWMLENSPIAPIKVVGWEGIFGFVVTVLLMVIGHLAIGQTDAGRYGIFDMKEGLRQMIENRELAITSVLIMISIGGFNFFGLSVTRSVSATARSTIDTCRTLFIWIVSLGLGWERFKWLQVLGFAILVYATFVFNGIVQPPFRALRPDEDDESVTETLLPEEPIEHM
jgi:hypothetical protein